jgi:LemA protein
MLYIIILAIILFIVLLFTSLYNSLIRKKNDIENAFASIDVMLKKRYDLIPAVVNAVKGYMKHEKELLTEITSLRTKVLSGGLSNEEKVKADNQIRQKLSDILVAVENYPDLKASRNFLQLQGILNEVEGQLAASRRAFNAAVTTYNNSVEVFPSNMVASIINYKRRTLFYIPEAEKVKPEVNPLADNRLG